ncbi:transcription factor ORG2-like [Aristolochia californica]|uniref:transcription factor ORG2-like n=1 Tax=Aristolochia californica TaxID=171875 RepID=UPI0035DB85A7
MCALSPPWFPNYGWPVELETINDPKSWPMDDAFASYSCRGEVSSESLLRISSSPPEADVEVLTPRNSGDDPSTVKKLSHNANERDRRKKLNSLYASLRSLLPGSDQTKKLSIPTTVSRVLKYIPELQKQVELLTQRKEEILSKMSRQGDKTHPSGGKRGPTVVSSFPTIVVSPIDDRELIVQIYTIDVKRSPLSKVLLNLEEEGLRVLNASAFAFLGDRVFYNLHLQVKGTPTMECGMLSEKLLSLYRSKTEEM